MIIFDEISLFFQTFVKKLHGTVSCHQSLIQYFVRKQRVKEKILTVLIEQDMWETVDSVFQSQRFWQLLV